MSVLLQDWQVYQCCHPFFFKPPRHQQQNALQLLQKRIVELLVLQCDGCQKWNHRTCNSGISRQAYRAAVQTDTEIEWHCESCAVKWSTPGEPVAVSSRLENSLSTSSEPLHSPTIEVSWGPHSGQFLKEQFEDSTVDGTIEDSTEDPTIQECPVGEFPVTYKIVEQDSKRAK